MTKAPLCKRCGLPIYATDAPFAHSNCDENHETWLTDQERAEKEERIRAYEKRKYGQPATLDSLLDQIQRTAQMIERKI